MVLRLAWRSVWRHRRRTLITVASIGLGLTVVVFSLTLAEGMYRQLIDDAVRMQAGHVTLEPAEYRDAPSVDLRVAGVTALRERIAQVPGVESTKLLVLGQGVGSTGRDSSGVSLLGVEPDVEQRTSPLAKHIIAGSWFDDEQGAATPKVIIGALLADRLDLQPGKKLVLTTNDATGNLVETLFRVQGVFQAGTEEIDGYLVLTPIDAARRVFGLGDDEATQVGVVIDDPSDVDDVQRAARAVVRDQTVAVLPWQKVIPELWGFMQLDRVSNRVFHGLLLVLILFTIVNTILMSVLERRHEFAVQMALGTAPRQLCAQLLGEAAVIGLCGCALGIGLGGSIASVIAARGWDLTALYGEGMTISGFAVDPVVHSHVSAGLLARLALLVFGATLASSLPAMGRAVRVPLAEVLR